MIKTVDFERLTKHFTEYQNGVEQLQVRKQAFIEKGEPIKNEFEALVMKQSTSELTEEDQAKMQELGAELQAIDNEYRNVMSSLDSTLSQDILSKLQGFISTVAKEKGYAVVLNFSDVAYASPEVDVTDEVLEVIKANGVYVDVE